MTRKVYDLDGEWDFIYDEHSQFIIEDIHHKNWSSVTVPAPWQPQIKGLEESTGTGWYRKSFTFNRDLNETTIVLHVGAAYHYAQVWLNGHYIGDHDGGWLPFELTLDDFIKDNDKNDLIIRVVVPDNNREQYPDFPASEILHGKQSWYGSWGGLWQSVYIEARATTHIENLQINMDMDHNVITPIITLNQWREGLSWQVDILDSDGSILGTEVFDNLMDRIESDNLVLQHAPQLWSPDSPYLYTVRVRLIQNGYVIDEVKKRTGFRNIETHDGKILLNGQPFYMVGALDQDYYPETLATPPSEDFLRDQFQKAKDMGLNTIRYHIKVADPRYYELADEMGLLLWVDLPNWTMLTDATKARVKATLSGMVQRDDHHPSICIWTIVNEDWGTDIVHNSDHRQWLRETYHWLKTLDPSRLVVDNSPCEPNFHIESDIADYHYYRSIPDHADEWDQLTHTIATDRSHIYSPNGDAHYTGQEPIIVSEFGNWGIPDFTNLLDENGSEPWWFETGHDWGEGIVYPHAVKRRFTQWHLAQVFGSFEALVDAMQWQQYRALKHEIESIRSYSEIQGYVITELTDVHWENNGLMDMRRKPRIFAPYLARLNADALVIAQLDRTAYTSGDSIHFNLSVSCLKDSTEPIQAIEWKLDNDRGMVELGNLTQGINQIAQVSVRQIVEQAEIKTLCLYVHYKSGEKLLSNTYDVPIYPAIIPEPYTIYLTDRHLKPTFEALGYTIVSNQRDADVVVVSKMTDDLKTFIATGGRVLLVADDANALPKYESGYVIYQDVPFARIMDRQTTIWNGDWVSSFTWLNPNFKSLASPLLDAQFSDIVPDFVLTGFTQSDMVQDVMVGLFVGWLHRPVTLLGFRNYHQGCIALTTFKLANLDIRNVAQVELVDLIFKHLAKYKPTV